MTLKSYIIRIVIIFICLIPAIHGAGEPSANYLIESTADDWPDLYYILFGVFIAAVVLYVMTVMKEPDELN